MKFGKFVYINHNSKTLANINSKTSINIKVTNIPTNLMINPNAQAEDLEQTRDLSTKKTQKH